MCTLILGVSTLEPRSVLVAANRDEDPARPSDPPRVLSERPRIAGGRDARSGGTWLAVRGCHALVALLNRRASGPGPEAPRSRGLLALDVAAAEPAPGESLAAAAEARLRREAARHAFAPFSLLFASPAACWYATHEPAAPLRVDSVVPGWHVITHRALDDPDEPRTRALLAGIVNWEPPTLDRAIEGLRSRLALHGGEPGGVPPVCIHDGRMSTVSAAVVWLAASGARYLHAEGRPCVTRWEDHTQLLEPGDSTS